MYDKQIGRVMKDTYDYIVCRITGQKKKVISEPYLHKLGYTKDQYLKEFESAQFMCGATRDAYKKAAMSKEGRKMRSRTMSFLNQDDDFRQKRVSGILSFYQTEEGEQKKRATSARAKQQHKDGLDDSIREYFRTDYIGSEDQKQRSKRMKENNPSHNPEIVKKQKEGYIRSIQEGNIFRRKKYKNTHLTYQSSYENHFLDFYFEQGYPVEDLDNAPVLNDHLYPGHMYEPDYLYQEKYIIEIKSWYIANLQENQKSFDVLKEKQKLSERQNYEFIYLLDKDYNPFLKIHKIQ